jgi:hypothetical protein
VAFLSRLVKFYDGEITLIGSKEESDLSKSVLAQVASKKIKNKVGQTQWSDLFLMLKRASLFVGADSGPLHLANLSQCPSLNLSVGNVRFWETGPTVKRSRILVSRDPSHLMSDVVFDHAREMLSGSKEVDHYFGCSGSYPVVYENHSAGEPPPDAWPVVEWMHFGGPIPILKGDLPAALVQLEEIANVALQNIEVLEQKPEQKHVIAILDRLDEVLEIFRKNILPLAPLVEAFVTEKENIPPTSREEVFFMTKSCYLNLKERVLKLKDSSQLRKESLHGKDDRSDLECR